MASSRGTKVTGQTGIYQEADEAGNTTYTPVLKVAGREQDLGSYPNPQDAALAYDICKLHAAHCYNEGWEVGNGREKVVLDTLKLNNRLEFYLDNVAFQNLCDNVSAEECPSLIKSGVLLDQFQARYRPVLRAKTHPRGPAVPSHSKREGSPSLAHYNEQKQPARSQSHSLERQRSEKGRAEAAAPVAAQPETNRERQSDHAEPAAAKQAVPGKHAKPSAATAASKAAFGGGDEAGGSEPPDKSKGSKDEEKKRKARWMLYPSEDGSQEMHTVWISERTAGGNSLSIPGSVKDNAFAEAKDGDLITAVNQRSRLEYKWRYRDLRKEGESGPPKHYLSGAEMKTFINETHLKCGDVLQVVPAGPHRASFIIHRSETEFVRRFLEYIDSKHSRGEGSGGRKQAGEARGGGKKPAAGPDSTREVSAARSGPSQQPKQQQPERKDKGQQEKAQQREGRQGIAPAEAKQQQQQQQHSELPKVKTHPSGVQKGPLSPIASPKSPRPTPFAATIGGHGAAEHQGYKQAADKPRSKPSRVWAEFPQNSGQYAVDVTEGMLKTTQITLPVAVWSALLGAQQDEPGYVKAVSKADGKGYPMTWHPNAETGGGQLQNLSMLFRNHAVAVGDVVALQPADQGADGCTVLRFQLWKEDSEDAAKFRKLRQERLRRTKSMPTKPSCEAVSDVAGDKHKPAPEGNGAPSRFVVSGPKLESSAGAGSQQKSGRRPMEEQPKPKQKQQQQQAPALPVRRRPVLEDSSSEDEGLAPPARQAKPNQQQQQQQRAQQGAAQQQHGGDAGGDPSPKRKAGGEVEVPAAKRREAPTGAGRTELSPCSPKVSAKPSFGGVSKEAVQQQQQQQQHLDRQRSHLVDEDQDLGPAHGKRPSPEPDTSYPGQQQQQQQQNMPQGSGPATASAPALPDLSHLPPRKRMMLMAQQSLGVQQQGAGLSGAQSTGAVARAAAEGAGDSQGDSVRRRGTAAGLSWSHQQQRQQEQHPQGEPVLQAAASRGVVSAGGDLSPRAPGVSVRAGGGYKAEDNVGYTGRDPSAPDDNGLPTPTSPPVPKNTSPVEQPALHVQHQGARQTSPVAYSSGTAGDRSQLRNMGSYTAAPLDRAGGAVAGTSQGIERRDTQGTSREVGIDRHQGSRFQGAPAVHQPCHLQPQQQPQQPEYSGPVAPAPSGSAAMGSAGQGPELPDAHLIRNDETAVLQEVMRLIDLTMAAGKVTPELAADLKFGLGMQPPLQRWMSYSVLKPLYDHASWDKLVEMLKRAAKAG